MQDPIIVNQAPTRPPRRTYTKEFKIDAVAQCERGDRSLAQVAMDLKINANLVRRWQKELNGDFGSTKLLPVKVSHSVQALDPNDFIEINIAANTLKIVGTVDSQYVVQLVSSLR